MITALNAGKFDVIMDALSITPERKEVIDFTVPYAATPAVFAAPKDGALANLAGTGSVIKLATTKDGADAIAPLKKALTGKTIGIQASTVYAGFIYDNFKDVAEIKEYKTSAERAISICRPVASTRALTTLPISSVPSRAPTTPISPSRARKSLVRSGARAKVSASASPIRS